MRSGLQWCNISQGFLPSLVLAIVVALAAVILCETSSFHTGMLLC